MTQLDADDELLEGEDLQKVLAATNTWILSRAMDLPCILHWATGRVQVRRADIKVWRAALNEPERRQRRPASRGY